MILDQHGKPIRRAAGFVTRWSPAREIRSETVSAVGFQVALEPEAEEPDDEIVTTSQFSQ